MGLFKKTNKKKEISSYEIMEEYKIDLIENKLYIEKFGETDKYIFYIFSPPESIVQFKYLLRQSKENPNKIVYFGSKSSNICIFQNYLFYAYERGEMDRHDFIYARDVDNGNLQRYQWLGKNGNYIYINGYGRAYNQDTVQSMYIEDNALFINIHREKGKVYNETDKNYEMDYKIRVENKNNTFIPTYFYQDEKGNVYNSNNNEIAENNNENFDNICNHIFNNSMNTINFINEKTIDFGTKPLIENDKNSFVLKTFLFCLYFYNLNMYKNNIVDRNTRNEIYDLLIDEMCKRTNIDFSQAQKDYIIIRDLLDNLPDDR